MLGEGKIGLSLVQDSYRWVLAGQTGAHAAYWAFMISELARKAGSRGQLLLPQPPVYFVDEPLGIRLFSQNMQPAAIIRANSGKPDSLFFRQDESEPALWRTTFRPAETGWHPITTTGGATTAFFVSVKAAWQTWQQASKIASTRRFALLSHRQIDGSTAMLHRYRPIPLIWLFVVFLACCTFLWAEKKF